MSRCASRESPPKRAIDLDQPVGLVLADLILAGDCGEMLARQLFHEIDSLRDAQMACINEVGAKEDVEIAHLDTLHLPGELVKNRQGVFIRPAGGTPALRPAGRRRDVL